MAKTLPEHRVQAIQAFVRRIMQTDFEGSISATARALGMAQSQLSDLLNDRRGLGLAGVERVADYAGVTIDEVVGRKPPQARSSSGVRRDLAAELARDDAVQEAAIQAVLAEELKPEDAQRSILWWARRMRFREGEMETGRELPATTIRRKKA